jgi:hypothetical protein
MITLLHKVFLNPGRQIKDRNLLDLCIQLIRKQEEAAIEERNL